MSATTKVKAEGEEEGTVNYGSTYCRKNEAYCRRKVHPDLAPEWGSLLQDSSIRVSTLALLVQAIDGLLYLLPRRTICESYDVSQS